jgi:hypothetical protein
MWLKSQRFRKAICFMHHRLEMRDDALVYLTSADEKIVSALPFLEYRWYPWIFEFYLRKMTQIIPAADLNDASKDKDDIASTFERKVPHVFDRQRHFYKHMTGHELPNHPLERAFSQDVRTLKKIVVLNPGAQSLERVWPLKEWAKLAAAIVKDGYAVRFTGGPAEEVLVPELTEMIKGATSHDYDTDQIRILINKLSFGNTIELFRQAKCYIGPDTGGSHLAYWLGIPTITILHRDPKMEAYHRLGDFFPYPENVRDTPYKCVWATLDEFQLRNDSDGVGKQVLDAFNALMQDTNN